MPTYRALHEQQLRENRPAMYADLKRSGELPGYLDDIAQEAREMYTLVLKQLAEKSPYAPTDWDNDRAAWEGWLERTARELVLHDLVMVPDEETERAMRDGY